MLYTSGGHKLRQNKTPCELVHLPDVSLRKILGLENLQAKWFLVVEGGGILLNACCFIFLENGRLQAPGITAFLGTQKGSLMMILREEKGEWRFVRSYLYDPMWVGLPTQMATWNLKSSLLKTKNGLINLHFGVSCLFLGVSSLEYNFHILWYEFIFIYIYHERYDDMNIWCIITDIELHWKLTCSLRRVDTFWRFPAFSASTFTFPGCIACFFGGWVKTLPAKMPQLPIISSLKSGQRQRLRKALLVRDRHGTQRVSWSLKKTKIGAQKAGGELEVMVRLHRSRSHCHPIIGIEKNGAAWSLCLLKSGRFTHYNPGCVGQHI